MKHLDGCGATLRQLVKVVHHQTVQHRRRLQSPRTFLQRTLGTPVGQEVVSLKDEHGQRALAGIIALLVASGIQLPALADGLLQFLAVGYFVEELASARHCFFKKSSL